MMTVLNQCISILGLTSFDWGKRRMEMVAHSFRVMSRARNYDEMVVGIMHHAYAYSRYTRTLFGCDVPCSYMWTEELNLLTGKNRKTDNAGQGVEEWTSEQCIWTTGFKRKLEQICNNRTARNVMIYDLEDMLELLIRENKPAAVNSDSEPLIYSLSDSDRTNLIEKCSRALVCLRRSRDDEPPQEGDFSDSEYEEISAGCRKWHEEWEMEEMELLDYFENEDQEK